MSANYKLMGNSEQLCYQEFENDKIISQIVGSGKWCVQNGERVPKSDKNYYICIKTKKAINGIRKIWDSVCI